MTLWFHSHLKKISWEKHNWDASKIDPCFFLRSRWYLDYKLHVFEWKLSLEVVFTRTKYEYGPSWLHSFFKGVQINKTNNQYSTINPPPFPPHKKLHHVWIFSQTPIVIELLLLCKIFFPKSYDLSLFTFFSFLRQQYRLIIFRKSLFKENK